MGNLQRTLHALNYEEHQTTGISAPCCETVESIIRESCHVFSGAFVKRGSVMLSRNPFLSMWLKKKAKFLPAYVSDKATKPCFISALGKIFALISSKQAHFYAWPSRPGRRVRQHQKLNVDPRFCLFTHIHIQSSTSIRTFSDTIKTNRLQP